MSQLLSLSVDYKSWLILVPLNSLSEFQQRVGDTETTSAGDKGLGLSNRFILAAPGTEVRLPATDMYARKSNIYPGISHSKWGVQTYVQVHTGARDWKLKSWMTFSAATNDPRACNSPLITGISLR